MVKEATVSPKAKKKKATKKQPPKEEFLNLLIGYQNRLGDFDMTPEEFSSLFAEGVEFLGFDDKDVAKRFSASRPTANQWRNGKAPALEMCKLVIRELEKCTSMQIRKLENQLQKQEPVATKQKKATKKPKRATLFEKKTFKMHSGGTAFYKIECDSLTDEDLDCLAFIVADKASHMVRNQEGSGIRSVYGVPSGGVRFANAIKKYIDPNGTIDLIVDDVLTTGASMEAAKSRGLGDYGVVIFARGRCPDWVKPIFEMHWFDTVDECA